MTQLLTEQEVEVMSEELKIIALIFTEDYWGKDPEKTKWYESDPEYKGYIAQHAEIYRTLLHDGNRKEEIRRENKRKEKRESRKEYIKGIHALGLTVAEVEHPYSQAARDASLRREIRSEAYANRY
ncbi:MAG TPA: hypothetical protein VHV10_05010 [Ktedonobacteraceae bacterium]|jgi:predicted transposase YdaD|nr:hypothetical protein [Ktedonobacteraceae bacterium]